MGKKQIKFGANGLNALSDALNTVSEAVEKAEKSPVQEPQPEPQPVAEEPKGRVEDTPVQPAYAEAEKSPKKETVGVNVVLPKDIYKRLQMMRIDLDGMPLRSLCLDLIIKGLEDYEKRSV